MHRLTGLSFLIGSLSVGALCAAAGTAEIPPPALLTASNSNTCSAEPAAGIT